MSYPSRVRIGGPLVSHAAGFRAALEAQGYRHHAVGCQLYVMAHLVAGNPAFLGFIQLTWVALVGHILFAWVIAFVVRLRT